MEKEFHENIILGAGPAGLQLGYFFQKEGVPHIILEKNSMAGSFFDVFPHSGELISINKKYTGSDNLEFNLRHDWNSLLTDDENGLLFTNYSDAFYPKKEDMVRYLGDFAIKYCPSILYNIRVFSIFKSSDDQYNLYCMDENRQRHFVCKKLIVAMGISLPRSSPIIISRTKDKIMHYGDFKKDHFKKKENLESFRNKTLLIIGNGNAAHELANLLTPWCSSINILGKTHKPWAMSTHYTGDLRSVYLPFHDTFFLKSLNALDTSSNQCRYFIDQDPSCSKYIVSFLCSQTCTENHVYIKRSRSSWDHVILCTGWCFDKSIFLFDLAMTHRYPAIDPRSFESVNNKGLFFIGSLMHSVDNYKSSGGFIHGFRYLIRFFFRYNYKKQMDEIRIYGISSLVDHLIKRINISSGLYQMHGYLCDMFYSDESTSQFLYLHEVPIHHYYFDSLWSKHAPIFLLTLEYGSTHVTDIYKLGNRVTNIGTESSATLLHPVIRIFNEEKKLVDEIHFDEDLFTNFSDNSIYVKKMFRTLRMFFS